jgi:hypothetical protein
VYTVLLVVLGACSHWWLLWVTVLPHSKLNTQERAIILLHRYFTVNSSTECTALDKWVSTSCIDWHVPPPPVPSRHPGLHQRGCACCAEA